MNQDELVRQLVEKWPSALVARSEVERFSGGLVSAHTLANHDCAGTGPQGRVSIRGRVAYPVESLARWLVEQMGVRRDPSRARKAKQQRLEQGGGHV